MLHACPFLGQRVVSNAAANPVNLSMGFLFGSSTLWVMLKAYDLPEQGAVWQII